MEKQMKCAKLVEDLKRQIMSGEIRPGDKIPSENVLAKEYDISRQTVRKAIDILRNEGFLYAEHGRGTFCSDMIKQEGNSGNIAVVMTYLSDYIFPYIIRGIDEVLEKEDYAYCEDSFGYFEGDEDVYRIIQNMTPYFRQMVDRYVEGEQEIIYVDAGV